MDIIPPTVKIGCAKCFANLSFHGAKFTINSGCLLFRVILSQTISPTSKTLLNTITKNNINLEWYLELVHSLTKANLDLLMSIKVHVPTHYEEAQLQIKQYDPFLGTFLGTCHLVYCDYQNSHKLVLRHWMTFIKKTDMCYGNAKVGPMLIV